MKKQNLCNLVKEYLSRYPKDRHGLDVLDFLNKYDKFWQRDNEYGHITASAWIINESKDRVLLTHHKKLNIWVQLGGHIESEDKDIYDASKRELIEESGLQNFKLLSKDIYDIDVHSIPESKSGVPKHFHFDIRLLFGTDSSNKIQFDQEESQEVRWIPIDQIENYTSEESVLRMIRKL